MLAARKLGMESVPCLRLGHLTEAQKRAYVIADNKLALNAGWDEALLKIELSDLSDEDFDLELIGFDASEIQSLLGKSEDEGNEDNSDGVEIHSVFEVIAECQHEEEQQMVYNILNEKGIKCRLSTL